MSVANGEYGLPDIAVGLVVFSLPFGGYVDGLGGHLGFPVVNTALLGFAGLAVAGDVLDRRRLSLTRLQGQTLALFGAFLAVLLLSTVATAGGRPGTAVTYTHVRYLGYFVLVGLVVAYVRSQRELQLLLAVGFLSAVVASLLTVASSVLHLDIGQRFHASRSVAGVDIPFVRAIGVPLAFGAFGIFVVGVVSYYGYSLVTRRRLALAVPVGLCLLAVLLAQSRIAWIAVLTAVGVGCVGTVARSYREGSELRRLGYLAVAVVGTLVGLAVLSRVTILLVEVNSGTVQSRFAQYAAAIEAMSQAPLLGVGEANVRSITPDGQEPHRAVLRVGASVGVPAAILVTLMPVAVFVTAFRDAVWNDEIATGVALAAVAATAAVLVNAQFVTAFGKVGWVWIAVAACYGYWTPEPAGRSI